MHAMKFVAHWFGYGKAEGKEKDASTKAVIKKSLQEGQTVAENIETRFTALKQAISYRMKAKDEQVKAQQHGQVIFERLLEDMEGLGEAIQMNKDWLKKFQEHIDELSKTESPNRNKALGQERKLPAQRNLEFNNDSEANISENETSREIKSDSSSRKKADLAQKRQVVSLLYCPHKVDLVPSVVTKLVDMLLIHLSTHGIDLKIQICETVQDIREGIPLIVICLHSSRLGTDVSNALSGIRTGPNVAVIVVHHKDIHALPSTSSSKILTAQEFQRVGAIFDMGFLSQKGFYTCDINSKAIEALTCFIAGRRGM